MIAAAEPVADKAYLPLLIEQVWCLPTTEAPSTPTTQLLRSSQLNQQKTSTPSNTHLHLILPSCLEWRSSTLVPLLENQLENPPSTHIKMSNHYKSGYNVDVERQYSPDYPAEKQLAGPISAYADETGAVAGESFEYGDSTYAKLQRFAGRFRIEQRGIERVPENERTDRHVYNIGTMVLTLPLSLLSLLDDVAHARSDERTERRSR